MNFLRAGSIQHYQRLRRRAPTLWEKPILPIHYFREKEIPVLFQCQHANVSNVHDHALLSAADS